jgi:diacylglycerol O-acyltransferase / wax synthase
VDRLSALSAAFLSAEDVDPESSMVIGSFAVLEGPAPSVDEVRERVATRLGLAPRYRQRLHRTLLDLRPLGWEDDPDLDLARHVRIVGLPAPGGHREVADLVGRTMGERMDRHHPLWDVTVCEGLADGRWGLLCRIHHALADGVSGTALMRVLYDVAEEAAPRSVGVAAPEQSSLRRLAGTALAASRGALALGAAVLPVHGPSLLGTVDGGRRYAWTSVLLDDALRDVRRELGVTMNDVALAAASAGFRALLLHRGLEPHRRSVRSLVPVSAWAGSAADEPDNRVTLMLADLPVDVADPVARVRQVHEVVARLRRSGEPAAGLVGQQLLGAVPYPLLAGATRWALRLPHHHLSTVTTNVPGPRQPVFCLGRRVERLLPYVPIADGVRIGVAMFSYCDRLTFGVTGDAHVTDLDVLVEGIREGWQELSGAKVPAVEDLWP